jgi:DTW domain-containing protein YfiP
VESLKPQSLNLERTLPLHLLLEELNSFKEGHIFDRAPFLDRSKGILKCDCAGLITLLLKELQLFPAALPSLPKAKDYFQYIETLGAKENIKELKRHDILCWKKDNIPQSGDTGHILIINRKPKKITEEKYSLDILEVNRFSKGIQTREIQIHTLKDGRIWGIAWQPNKMKVKKTKVVGREIFRKKNCSKCDQVETLCLCPYFPQKKRTPPSIIILRHPDERKHPLATVPLLQRYFKDLCVIEGEIFKETKGTLIYPHDSRAIEKGLPINQTLTELPLILIDATWKKSKRILYQNPWLSKLPRYEISGLQSNYLIRKQKSPGALNTLETFCACWKELEPKKTDEQQELLSAFHTFIEKKVNFIGSQRLKENYLQDFS